MDSNTQRYIFIFMGLFVVSIISLMIYSFVKNKKEYYSPDTRDYLYLNPDQHLSYNPNVKLVKTDYDQQYTGIDFAQMSGLDYTPKLGTNKMEKRFEKVHKNDLLPKMASYVTGYDVDLADPKFYFFGSRQPRVVLKDRLYALADPFRGDIPIKKHSEICMVDRPAKGREAQRFSGTFNPMYEQMMKDYQYAADYDASQLANKNYPGYTSREETVMDI